MNRNQLFKQIQKKKSFLCIGLDSDIQKIPRHLLEFDDPVFEFNKQLIDATHRYAVAYKPNIAFYESRGSKGWISLEKTITYLQQFDVFTIADAKRGDIGNTSKMYVQTFFSNLNFDALTVAPYMGSDSVEPFLAYPDKWVILLALTSNKGANDFQFLQNNADTSRLYETVLQKAQNWGTPDQLMFVVGATQAEMLKGIRALIPDHFLLVPGVGAQGGSLQEVAHYGINQQCGLLVNSSRGIIYASGNADFANKAAEKAQELQIGMEEILSKNNLL